MSYLTCKKLSAEALPAPQTTSTTILGIKSRKTSDRGFRVKKSRANTASVYFKTIGIYNKTILMQILNLINLLKH